MKVNRPNSPAKRKVIDSLFRKMQKIRSFMIELKLNTTNLSKETIESK